MKKYLSLLVVLLTTLFAANSLAYTPPPAPQKGWYVSDQAGRLSPDQINQLNQKIERVSKATKNEFGILLLQDMGGDNIEDVANATFKAWGIGKRGLDNGCLIVVAIKERKSRIETGKGVEGEVTDLQASDILKKNLNPHLKQSDFAGGFSDTLDALSSLIESRHNKKADPPPAMPPNTTPTSPHVSNGCDVAPAPGADGYGLTMAGILLAGVALMLGLRALSRYRTKKETERLRQLEIEMAAESEARAERDRAANERRAKQMEDESRRRAAEAARQHTLEVERRKSMPPPPVPTPPMPKMTAASRPTTTSRPPPLPVKKIAVPVAAIVVASTAVLELERTRREEAKREQEEKDRRRRRDQEESDRRRREQDEEDERRRRRDSDSSSSNSSSDWGGGSSDSGGGFGGGDSGGGGSSSDW